MAKQRPINLNLFTIKFPIPAIISILHRASGALLFILVPLLLWMLETSLTSSESFDDLQETLSNPWLKWTLLLFLAAFFYHLVAGIRHLIMDLGIGESLKAARASSWATLIVAGILIVLAGLWLCQIN